MIYFLEDDEAIRELVVYTLNNSGQQARGFERAEEFFKAVSESVPQLVLLDLMLPETDGLTVLGKLRRMAAASFVPVMIITAKGSEYDRVKGLDCGADDYMVKPFGMMELLARVRALLRRGTPPKNIDVDGITIDEDSHTVSANGERIELTLKEYELLRLLARSPNRVFTRDMLLSEIWGYDFTGESRTVDVHIRTLRVKLGDSGEMIETVRGVGYRMKG